MTAGMTTPKLEGSRVSLPRAGLGALLAATLLAGGLIGAAVCAGVGTTIAQPVAVSVSHASTVARDQPIHAVRGLLIRESDGAGVAHSITTTMNPQLRDGFDPGDLKGRATDSGPGKYAPFTYVPGKHPLP
jgi:hypothetical protein